MTQITFIEFINASINTDAESRIELAIGRYRNYIKYVLSLTIIISTITLNNVMLLALIT